jgi:hypothetical protein
VKIYWIIKIYNILDKLHYKIAKYFLNVYKNIINKINMDYYNIIPYRNLAVGTFLIGIFTYYGISLINLLVTVIYPIIKIQAYLHDPKINSIIDKTNKELSIEDMDFILEGLFWLKYWCVYALWYVIEYYLYYFPLISYIKLGLFGYILIKHDLDKDTKLYFYDNIDKLVVTDYREQLQGNIYLVRDRVMELYKLAMTNYKQ